MKLKVTLLLPLFCAWTWLSAQDNYREFEWTSEADVDWFWNTGINCAGTGEASIVRFGRSVSYHGENISNYPNVETGNLQDRINVERFSGQKSIEFFTYSGIPDPCNDNLTAHRAEIGGRDMYGIQREFGTNYANGTELCADVANGNLTFEDVTTQGSLAVQEGSVVWFGWSEMWTELDRDHSTTIMQFRSNCKNGSPRTSLNIRPNPNDPQNPMMNLSIGGFDFQDPIGIVEENVWYDFVVEIKYSKQNDGYIRVWRSESQPNAASTLTPSSTPSAEFNGYNTMWVDCQTRNTGTMYDYCPHVRWGVYRWQSGRKSSADVGQDNWHAVKYLNTARIYVGDDGATGFNAVVPRSDNPTTSATNIALNKPVSQSSTYGNGVASFANDGNLTGSSPWGNADLQHTARENQAWWEVDLGESYEIESFKIYNRSDCCQNELSDFYVFVSDTEFGPSATLASTLANSSVNSERIQGNPQAVYEIPTVLTGRYVRIWNNKNNSPVHMAEVEVYGSAPCTLENLALGKNTNQSSTYGNGVASFAIDGNLTGTSPWANADLQHTARENQAWWEVDLGESYEIQSFKIYNRSDCCQNELSDFYVFVSDTEFGPSATLASTLADPGVNSERIQANPQSIYDIAFPVSGRYVRVWNNKNNSPVHMAEVEVWGCGNGSGGDPCEGIASIGITPTGPFAANAGLQQLSASPSGGTWSGLGVSPSGEFDPSQGEGSYTVSYTHTSSSGCTQMEDAIIQVTAPICFNTSNIALNKTANQSSTYGNGAASLANDGNLSGNSPWSADLQHTQDESQPWWKVDLENVSLIEEIKIVNRTNSSAFIQNRLSDFYLFISESSIASTQSLQDLLNSNSIQSTFSAGSAGVEKVFLFDPPISGKDIRIQLSDSDILHMAEVQVVGCNASNGGQTQRLAASEATSKPHAIRNASLEIIPNPTFDKATLWIESKETGNMKVSLFDMFGRLIQQENFYKKSEIGKFALGLSSFSPGVYTVQVKGAITSESIRLQIQ